MFTKITAVILAVLTVLLANTPLASIFKRKEIKHRYIIIQDAVSDEHITMLKNLYGENDPENEVMYAMGCCGPYLITQAPEQIASSVEEAFNLAMKYNIPVWFQIDDMNNSLYVYGGESYLTCDKWYENEENIEKVGFGDAPLATYYFNWGKFLKSTPMPCFNSKSFLEFLDKQLEDGFLKVLRKYLKILKEQNKEYLFAGVSVGWETRMPDYSVLTDDDIDQFGNSVPVELRKLVGYRALENLGYTEEKLAKEAKEKNMSVKMLTYELICQVLHDYSERIAKSIFDCGVEKEKIFTHFCINQNLITTDKNINTSFPEIWTSVNDYSTPGYTCDNDISFWKMSLLKAKIAEADPSQKHFGIVEGYARGLQTDKEETLSYFNKLFNMGSIVIAVYGINDHEDSIFYVPKSPDSPFSQAVREIINK